MSVHFSLLINFDMNEGKDKQIP